MNKLEQLQTRKKKLDEQIRLAKEQLRRDNKKIRDHRLIQLGSEIEKFLKVRENFDIMNLEKQDFDYYLQYWQSQLKGLPKFERPDRQGIVFVKLTKHDPDFQEIYKKLKDAKARWSSELQLWEVEASKVEELQITNKVVR